jgi:hypothetical protein
MKGKDNERCSGECFLSWGSGIDVNCFRLFLIRQPDFLDVISRDYLSENEMELESEIGAWLDLIGI